VRNQYDALVTGYRSVRLQERNVDLARESVRLTTERYRIGAATYIQLQAATSQATQTEQGLINARYEFMKTLARLQAAVGRPIVIPQ
jgi:outer membrane protein TolC